MPTILHHVVFLLLKFNSEDLLHNVAYARIVDEKQGTFELSTCPAYQSSTAARNAEDDYALASYTGDETSMV